MSAFQGTTNQQSNIGELHPFVEEVVTHASSSGTTHNVAMPAEVEPGRLLLVFVVVDNDDQAMEPDGWTELVNDQIIGQQAASIFAKVAVGTEGGTTVNFETFASEALVAQVFMIDTWSGSGVNVDVDITMETFSVPYEAAPWGSFANLWIVSLSGSMSGTYSASPPGYSDLVEVKTGDTVNDAQLYTCRLLNMASISSPGDWIFSNPVGSWGTASVAIKGATAE